MRSSKADKSNETILYFNKPPNEARVAGVSGKGGDMLYATFLNYHDTPSLRGRVIDISPSLPAMALF